MVRFGERKGKEGDKTIISKINEIIKNSYLCSCAFLPLVSSLCLFLLDTLIDFFVQDFTQLC